MKESRLEALRARHAALESALDDELKRPSPGLATVYMLKRQKLAVKDEIAGLARATERT